MGWPPGLARGPGRGREAENGDAAGRRRTQPRVRRTGRGQSAWGRRRVQARARGRKPSFAGEKAGVRPSLTTTDGREPRVGEPGPPA